MKERLYLFLGLFFVTIPAFADPATAMLISAGVSALSSIFGGVSAGAAKRQAERRERAAAANRMALEANRADIPDFGAEFENPAANLQVATRANEIQAEQADISLASTLDTLRATGASAGGATALARAASQSKRGVSASIQQQEARNAQLRAQGELQAAKIRQDAQVRTYQATVARENQQLNRAASLESSANQQAAAYSAQSSQMIGQAVGALGSFAAFGGFGADGPFAGRANENTNTRNLANQALSDKITAESDIYAEDMLIEEVDDLSYLGLN
tara:strand:+ start:14444 stop:15268 length:825 start_codon:yes stop_codon:yes gene_type:complete